MPIFTDALQRPSKGLFSDFILTLIFIHIKGQRGVTAIMQENCKMTRLYIIAKALRGNGLRAFLQVCIEKNSFLCIIMHKEKFDL